MYGEKTHIELDKETSMHRNFALWLEAPGTTRRRRDCRFLSGLDRQNCLIRKGLLSDWANGRSADGHGVLRRAWTRQRHGPLQMSAWTWSAIRNTASAGDILARSKMSPVG